MSINSRLANKTHLVVSVSALVAGVVAYGIGLVNAGMELNEKGYYLIVLLYGLFAFVSLQKNETDAVNGNKTSHGYRMMSLGSAIASVGLLAIGLYNADLLLSEKGFYLMAFILSLFAALTIQKNIADKQAIEME